MSRIVLRLAPATMAACLFLIACGGGSSPTSPSATPPPAPSPAPTPPPATQFVLGGEWVRVNSSFVTLDGMVVQVSGDATQARILSTPANPFHFQVGDVKWRAIARVGDRRFGFEDLVRQSGSGATSYVAGFIDANADGSELSMTFPSTGTVQQWRRR